MAFDDSTHTHDATTGLAEHLDGTEEGDAAEAPPPQVRTPTGRVVLLSFDPASD